MDGTSPRRWTSSVAGFLSFLVLDVRGGDSPKRPSPNERFSLHSFQRSRQKKYPHGTGPSCFSLSHSLSFSLSLSRDRLGLIFWWFLSSPRMDFFGAQSNIRSSEPPPPDESSKSTFTRYCTRPNSTKATKRCSHSPFKRHESDLGKQNQVKKERDLITQPVLPSDDVSNLATGVDR